MRTNQPTKAYAVRPKQNTFAAALGVVGNLLAILAFFLPAVVVELEWEIVEASWFEGQLAMLGFAGVGLAVFGCFFTMIARRLQFVTALGLLGVLGYFWHRILTVSSELSYAEAFELLDPGLGTYLLFVGGLLSLMSAIAPRSYAV